MRPVTPTKAVGSAEMRELDRRATEEFGIPSLLLMENAGRSVAEEILKEKVEMAAVVCGKGNNGGDGFVVARHLANHGVEARVTLIGKVSELKGDPAVNFKILEKMGVPIFLYEDSKPVREHVKKWKWAESGLIVDAIFGTGLSKSVSEPYFSAIQEINALGEKGIPVVSVDLPSGLNADTGEVMGIAVRAVKTVTLACEKKGLRMGIGPAYAGTIVIGDISLPRILLQTAR